LSATFDETANRLGALALRLTDRMEQAVTAEGVGSAAHRQRADRARAGPRPGPAMCRLCDTEVCGAERGQPCPVTQQALDLR
jgi:hypothetical protein